MAKLKRMDDPGRLVTVRPLHAYGICRVCDLLFLRAGTARVYCSPGCAKAAARKLSSRPKRCVICGDVFRYNGRRKYCGEACVRQAELDRRRPLRTVKCDQCGQRFTTRRSNAKRCSEECRREHSNSHFLRLYEVAREHGHAIPDVRRMLVKYLRMRDGSVCWLCGEVMDFSCFGTEDRAATVDHIVPKSLGGTYDPENLALAHMECNRRRGNMKPGRAAMRRLNALPFRTTTAPLGGREYA